MGRTPCFGAIVSGKKWYAELQAGSMGGSPRSRRRVGMTLREKANDKSPYHTLSSYSEIGHGIAYYRSQT
jgi:hypothetical protein